MSDHIPATMKALIIEDRGKVAVKDYPVTVVEDRGRIAVKDYPVPPVGDDDVLVRTVAVALNPTDWKHVDYPIGQIGSILGCDFSGYVVKVGKNVTTPKVGDHVTGFLHGGTFPDEGAFAEYVKTPAELVWTVPQNTLTHSEAAALQVALWTAIQALYHPTRLGLVEPPQKVSGEEWVLVYGASSAVGLAALQLLRLSGYKVVGTASPHNFAIVKQYGANEVFDYRDPAVVQKIKATTGDTIKKALDAISEKGTLKITIDSIGPSGGEVVSLLDLPDKELRNDVKVIRTLLYTATGRAFTWPWKHYPSSPEDRAQMAQFLKKLPQLVANGEIKPLPIKHCEGGLEAIPDGFQYMRDGKVSAQKIVYRL